MTELVNKLFPKQRINIEDIVNDIKLMNYSQIKQLAKDVKEDDKRYFTHHKEIKNKLDRQLDELYPIKKAKTTQEEEMYSQKRKPITAIFLARADTYTEIIKNNLDLINETINNRLIELQETALSLCKFDKKAYLNARVSCECGHLSYRKHLSRHKSTALHEKRMNILNSL